MRPARGEAGRAGRVAWEFPAGCFLSTDGTGFRVSAFVSFLRLTYLSLSP